MKYEHITNQPSLSAEWFDMRPIRRSDQGMIEFYGGDQRVARMTATIPHPLPPGAAADFISRSMSPDRTEHVWVMDATRTGGSELMGIVSLTVLERSQSEISYWVAPPYWNEGVAQAAVQTLVAANPLENSTIFGAVFQDNPISAKVLTNSGFEYIGDAEVFSVARDTTVPTWTYIKKIA